MDYYFILFLNFFSEFNFFVSLFSYLTFQTHSLSLARSLSLSFISRSSPSSPTTFFSSSLLPIFFFGALVSFAFLFLPTRSSWIFILLNLPTPTQGSRSFPSQLPSRRLQSVPYPIYTRSRVTILLWAINLSVPDLSFIPSPTRGLHVP